MNEIDPRINENYGSKCTICANSANEKQTFLTWLFEYLHFSVF